MESINLEDVNTVILNNGTPIEGSVTGARHRTQITFTFYDKRSAASIEFFAWTASHSKKDRRRICLRKSTTGALGSAFGVHSIVCVRK